MPRHARLCLGGGLCRHAYPELRIPLVTFRSPHLWTGDARSCREADVPLRGHDIAGAISGGRLSPSACQNSVSSPLDARYEAPMSSEKILPGGNTVGAVRIGDVVHKQASPWTPTVHALLRHLEDAGV